jgi:hypothetical protein
MKRRVKLFSTSNYVDGVAWLIERKEVVNYLKVEEGRRGRVRNNSAILA